MKWVCAVGVVLMVGVIFPSEVAGQDSSAVGRDSLAQHPDSVPRDSAGLPAAADSAARAARPPLKPFSALWRSLLVPGWGQARLDRKLTGGLFAMWEGVTLGMTLKASMELKYLEGQKSSRAAAKKGEVQDWLVLLVFNHIFSGLEAYVSAHLYDFPEDLRLQMGPTQRGFGGQMTIPIRIR